jgi:hypothetical protein
MCNIPVTAHREKASKKHTTAARFCVSGSGSCQGSSCFAIASSNRAPCEVKWGRGLFTVSHTINLQNLGMNAGAYDVCNSVPMKVRVVYGTTGIGKSHDRVIDLRPPD